MITERRLYVKLEMSNAGLAPHRNSEPFLGATPPGDETTQSLQTRSNFPETWLWTDLVSGYIFINPCIQEKSVDPYLMFS